MMTNQTDRGGQAENEPLRNNQPGQDQDTRTTGMGTDEEELVDADEELEDDLGDDEDVEEVSADEDAAIDDEDETDLEQDPSGSGDRRS